MSTHAYVFDETSGRAIYVHSDGYPEHLGRVLTDYHNSQVAVSEMMDLGHASFIDQRLHPVGDHGFDFHRREKGTSVFYGRDRGEAGNEALQLTGPITDEADLRDARSDLTEIFDDAAWGYHWNGENWRAYQL